MNNQQRYNRERQAQNDWAKRDFDAERMIEEVHRETISSLQRKIDDFYLSYARREGLTRLEANKIIQNFNVPAWAERAAQAVKYRDFSPHTNAWLKKYNTKQYISRLELLKAELEIDLQKMLSTDHYVINKHLEDEYLAELKRQSGVLGQSTTGSARRVKEVVNADFYGNDFSERIWGRNGYYDIHRRELFKSLNNMFTDMMGYKQERDRLMKMYRASEYETMRLLRTEASRIRSTAQHDMYNEHGFDYYRFVSEADSRVCKICGGLDGKVFPTKDMEIGLNMYPMHVNCRCSTYGIVKMTRKDGSTNLDEFEVVE